MARRDDDGAASQSVGRTILKYWYPVSASAAIHSQCAIWDLRLPSAALPDIPSGRCARITISESHLIFLDLQQSHDGPERCLLVEVDGEANLIAIGLDEEESFRDSCLRFLPAAASAPSAPFLRPCACACMCAWACAWWCACSNCSGDDCLTYIAESSIRFLDGPRCALWAPVGVRGAGGIEEEEEREEQSEGGRGTCAGYPAGPL